MNLISSIMTKNPCYTVGRKINPKGLMLHSIGTPQPSAQVLIKSWNTPSYNRACVHGFIDANTGDVYQTLPWNYRGWHCGKSGNNTHIGVEMCEPKWLRYSGSSSTFTVDESKVPECVDAIKRTYKSAVELFAELCEEFNLDPLAEGVIVSHHEGFELGIATNHGDPEHLWTYKPFGLSLTMQGFRQAVKLQMSEEAQNGTSFKEYKVRVSIPDLNIRKGPGVSYGTNGVTGRGVFTIVDQSGNWGKLKSGAGWISLAYAKRL